jgi:hypothetical protein
MTENNNSVWESVVRHQHHGDRKALAETFGNAFAGQKRGLVRRAMHSAFTTSVSTAHEICESCRERRSNLAIGCAAGNNASIHGYPHMPHTSRKRLC